MHRSFRDLLAATADDAVVIAPLLPVGPAIDELWAGGLAAARAYQTAWATAKGHVDAARYESVQAQLAAGTKDATVFVDVVRHFLANASGITPDGDQASAECVFPVGGPVAAQPPEPEGH